jgi:hypothetical protein
MAGKVRAYVAMREAYMRHPRRQSYWTRHPDELARRKQETVAFRALTDEEADALERDGVLPSPERIGQLSQATGLAREDLASIFRGFHYIMAEGVRAVATPREGAKGD